MGIITSEQPPVDSNGPDVWALVIEDMAARDRFGYGKYGTHLKPNNGREVLYDAYQETLDLCVYLRQLIYEKYGE